MLNALISFRFRGMADNSKGGPFTLGDDDQTRAAVRLRRPRRGAIFSRYNLISLCLVALLAGVVAVWFDLNRRFPLVAPGTYLGRIDGLFGDLPVGLYAERAIDSDRLVIVVLKDGWYPQGFRLKPVRGLAFVDDRASPLLLAGATSRLRFVGKQIDQGSYRGDVFDISNKRRGGWTLESAQYNQHDWVQDPEFLNLAELKADLQATVRQASLYEALIEGRMAKMVELKESIADRETLAAQAEETVAALKGKLVAQKQLLAEKEAEVVELHRQLEVAQRVTATGKLVTLARESLERENRWISSIARSDAGEAGFDSVSLEQAREIIELKRQIEDEMIEIERLEGAGDNQQSGRIGVATEPSTFDSLWQD